MNAWGNFFVAIVSAAAALTGLIFVGVSMSLSRILAIPTMPGRASESLILLVNALIVAALCLVPDQPIYWLGAEVLCINIIVWIITTRIDLRILSKTDSQYKIHSIVNIVFTQAAVLPYFAAGIYMHTCGICGLYWLIPGILLSFVKAVQDAWVILVEIHR